MEGSEHYMYIKVFTRPPGLILFPIPLVVETLKGWSQEAVETIKLIGRLQWQRLGLPTSETTAHLFQRLAIQLWRGNACMWAMHAPVMAPSIDGAL